MRPRGHGQADGAVGAWALRSWPSADCAVEESPGRQGLAGRLCDLHPGLRVSLSAAQKGEIPPCDVPCGCCDTLLPNLVT